MFLTGLSGEADAAHVYFVESFVEVTFPYFCENIINLKRKKTAAPTGKPFSLTVNMKFVWNSGPHVLHILYIFPIIVYIALKYQYYLHPAYLFRWFLIHEQVLIKHLDGKI